MFKHTGFIDKDNERFFEGVECNGLDDLKKIINFIHNFGYEAELSFDTKHINVNSINKIEKDERPSSVLLFLEIYDKDKDTSLEKLREMKPTKKILLTRGSLLIYDYHEKIFSVKRKEDLDIEFYEM